MAASRKDDSATMITTVMVNNNEAPPASLEEPLHPSANSDTQQFSCSRIFASSCCTSLQNIEEEISSRYKRVVRFAYRIFIAVTVYYCWQVVAAVASWLAINDVVKGVIIFVFAVFHVVVVVPLNYTFGFRPLYRAFRTGTQTLNVVSFFVATLISILWITVQALGIPGYTPGLINGSQFIRIDRTGCIIAGVLMLTTGLFGVVLVFLKVVLFFQVYQVRREPNILLNSRASNEFGWASLQTPRQSQCPEMSSSTA